MQSNQSPARMSVPVALNRQRNVIPQESQISTTKGAASLNDGFPPLTMTSPLQGGIPPFGQDMNGVLFLFAQTVRWVQAGGSFLYDATFANDPNVGGYPQGAVLLNATLSGFWINTIENNVTDPDATDGSAHGWLSMNPDWNATGGPGQILNRPDLAKVATSGQYDDLQGLPDLAVVATTGQYGDLLDKPNLAVVATTGNYDDLINTPAIPPEFTLPPATTTTLGGIIAGSGLAVTADGTLSATAQVKTVNTNAPDPNGNVSAIIQDAKGIVPGTSASLIQFQGGTGNPLMRVLQCHGVGSYTDWNGQMLEIDTVPATTSSLGTVMAGAGLAVAANGTLSTKGTAIVNLTGAANVALDLTPIVQGAPEILFNLPIAASTNTTVSIANPPASGTLAEFVLVVHNSASSAITWPSSIRWPQGIVPSLSGIAGKLDTFIVYTQDGGATYDGFVAGQNQ